MAKSQLIGFPGGGLEKKVSYRQDKPYTTPDCLNVRPQETIEGRERGGSRPGLQGPSSKENFGSEIRLLAPMSLAPERFMLLRELFPGLVLSDVWEEHEPIFGVQYGLPSLAGDGTAGTDLSEEEWLVVAVHTDVSIDVAQPYEIWMHVAPRSGAVNPGYFNIETRLSTNAPDTYEDGVSVSLQLNEIEGYYAIAWASTTGGSNDGSGYASGFPWTNDGTGGWFGASFDNNTLVSATFKGVTKTINMAHSNHPGTRSGFRLYSTFGGTPPYPSVGISAYNIQYRTTVSSEPPLNRTLLVASAGGNLLEEWSARG